MMSSIVNKLVLVSRILVGSLFIVSGLIKANDALGFSYKLEEYFSPDVLNMPWAEPWALQIAMFVCITEILLGVAVILGAKGKLTVWMLAVQILFFTWLTFYSAYFDKVADCGCFGDAIKLTPWGSFTKDLVLLVFISILFWKQNTIKLNTQKEDLIYIGASLLIIAGFSFGMLGWGFPLWFSILLFGLSLLLKKFVSLERVEWPLAGTLTVIIFGFSYYTLNHLPIKDFRPYAVGKSIPEQMVVPEGKRPPEYVYIYTLTDKLTGQTKDLNSKEYISTGIWEDKNWEITKTSDPILYKEGYVPPIHDFVIQDAEGYEITEDILSDENISFLLITHDLGKTGAFEKVGQDGVIGLEFFPNKEIDKVFVQVNEFAMRCQEAGFKFRAVTSSGSEEIEVFRHRMQCLFNFCTADQTMLKTVVRSNPGLVAIKKGVVLGKWHFNDWPVYKEVINKLN